MRHAAAMGVVVTLSFPASALAEPRGPADVEALIQDVELSFREANTIDSAASTQALVDTQPTRWAIRLPDDVDPSLSDEERDSRLSAAREARSERRVRATEWLVDAERKQQNQWQSFLAAHRAAREQDPGGHRDPWGLVVLGIEALYQVPSGALVAFASGPSLKRGADVLLMPIRTADVFGTRSIDAINEFVETHPKVKRVVVDKQVSVSFPTGEPESPPGPTYPADSDVTSGTEGSSQPSATYTIPNSGTEQGGAVVVTPVRERSGSRSPQGKPSTNGAFAPAPSPAAFDIEGAIARARQLTAGKHSSKDRACATKTRIALEEGGGLKLERAGNAKDYGEKLVQAGFRPVDHALPGFTPRKGDVVVIGGLTPTAPGHMALYDEAAGVWLSDFIQRTLYPNDAYRKQQPPYVVYRWPSGP